MRKFLLAASGVFLASSAFAADVIYDAPPRAIDVYMAPAFSWDGAYLGARGGLDLSHANAANGSDSISDTFNGGFIGGFAGWNYDVGNNIILGVEGDLNYNFNDNTYLGVQVGTDLSYSARARVGYGIDHALLFVTGGWAGTQGHVKVPAVAKLKDTFSGWTAGAGVDYAFTEQLFGRAEYRYADYGKKNFGDISVDYKEHTVGLGLGWKF